MFSTRVTQRIGADPTSVALLLADPTTAELWPRLARLKSDAAQDTVDIAVGSTAAGLRVLPPQRTPTAFVLCFDVDTAKLQHVEGRLELSHTGAEALATDAVLDLRSDRDLAEDAAEFLRRVAIAAEKRSRAA